jgi:hypothetical protein
VHRSEISSFMSVQGQTEKSSLRANVFRSSPIADTDEQ